MQTSQCTVVQAKNNSCHDKDQWMLHKKALTSPPSEDTSDHSTSEDFGIEPWNEHSEKSTELNRVGREICMVSNEDSCIKYKTIDSSFRDSDV